MKIAVTGGKGGTGKSTVATALATQLAKENKVLLVDADVDCPDDDLILSIKTRKTKDVENMIPEINEEKCIKCGKCAEACKENALVQVKKQTPFLVEDQCTGCKACKYTCPVNAITESKQKIGEISRGENSKISLVKADLKPGIEESSLVVNALKRYVEKEEDKYDHIIIDTAAGTHCPVIAALTGAEKALAVTEPTPLGNHDLKLILELLKKLEVPAKTVINRSDISSKKETEEIAEEFSSPVITGIPYSKKIQEDYAAGKPIEHEQINKIAEAIK